MQMIIITTEDDLIVALKNALKSIYPESRNSIVNMEQSETLSFAGALKFLNDNGFTISKAQLYKLTSKLEIPFAKFGNKIVFKRKELHKWATERCVKQTYDIDYDHPTLKSARKKLR